MHGRGDDETTLLAANEPAPVAVERREGASPFFLTCDHASNAIPRRLDGLGLEPAARARHIAWDIGAAAVARALSAHLDAALVLQRYSRLVIDCNRAPHVADSIPVVSEETAIPGNRDLDAAAVERRAREIFHPYHDTIAAALDARARGGRASILIAVHSFTPVYKGERRPWHVGILYNRDPRLAEIKLGLLAAEAGLYVGDNEPYSVSDETDYTIPVHGEGRGIPHVEIEIRQDLVASPAGQAEWARRLAAWLDQALARLRALEAVP